MRTILVEEQESFNVSEHYINFNSTHRARWSDFNLTLLNSIYLALTSDFFFNYN